VTATGPRLSAGLRAPDQRPSTGAIGRYFLCCLRAGYGDVRSRAPECEQRSCKVPLQPFLSATFSTADIYRTVRHICFVPEAVIRSPRRHKFARAHSGNPAFRSPSINSFACACLRRPILADIVKAGSTSSTRAAASRASASRPR
jgi:hypothetical protein